MFAKLLIMFAKMLIMFDQVMHPKNPFCPTMHFNYRYFETEVCVCARAPVRACVRALCVRVCARVLQGGGASPGLARPLVPSPPRPPLPPTPPSLPPSALEASSALPPDLLVQLPPV